jgi:hypothetical protein
MNQKIMFSREPRKQVRSGYAHSKSSPARTAESQSARTNPKSLGNLRIALPIKSSYSQLTKMSEVGMASERQTTSASSHQSHLV